MPNNIIKITYVFILSYGIFIIQLLRNILNNLGHNKVVAISYIAEAAVKIATFIFIIEFYEVNLFYPIFSWILAIYLVSLFLYYNFKLLNLHLSIKHYTISIVDIFKFSYPLSIGAIANWTQLQGYRVIFPLFGFTESIGIFSLISNIGSVGLASTLAAYSQVSLPRVYQTNGIYLKKYITYAIYIIAFVFCTSGFLGKEIISLITNSFYSKYWILLLFGILFEAFNFLIGSLSIKYTLRNNTSEIILISVYGIIAVISLYSILFYFHALNIYTFGVPILISQIIVLILTYLYSK